MVAYRSMKHDGLLLAMNGKVDNQMLSSSAFRPIQIAWKIHVTLLYL